VTLIQRFGSPLNANIHFHMFVLDGVCRMSGAEAPLRFVPAAAPDETEHAALLQRIAERIATGPREVQKVFTRRTLPAARDPCDFIARLAALLPRPRAHLTRYHGVLAPAIALWAGRAERAGPASAAWRDSRCARGNRETRGRAASRLALGRAAEARVRDRD